MIYYCFLDTNGFGIIFFQIPNIQGDAANAGKCHQQQNKMHHLIDRVSTGTLAVSHSRLLGIFILII